MSTKLTTPITRTPIHSQVVSSQGYVYVRKFKSEEWMKANPEATIIEKLSVDADASFLKYTVTSYDENLVEVKTIGERIFISDFPAGFKANVKTVHEQIILDAKAKDLIETGVETPDL